MPDQIFAVETISSGVANAPVLTLDAPISFWGGVDLTSGTITDSDHPNSGACLANKIVLVPCTKGSTAGPGALLELLNSSQSPAAIITKGPDLVVGLSARMSEYCGKSGVLVASLSNEDFDQIVRLDAELMGVVDETKLVLTRLSDNARVNQDAYE